MPAAALLARALVAVGALVQAVATPECTAAGPVGQDDAAMLQLGAFGGGGRAAAISAARGTTDEAVAAGEGGVARVGATCGGPGSYPRLNGTQYNWTSFQLEWMPSMLPTWGFFHSADEVPQLLMQRAESGRPSLDGPFVVLRLDDPTVGVSEALCAWDTQESLTCLITDGRLFGRFVVSAGLTSDCVPLKLTMPASYSAPSSGFNVAVRGGEMVLASTQALGAVLEEEVAAGVRHVAAGDNGSLPCAGYFPALAGSNYALTSYRLTHSSDQAADAATFQMDSSWTFNFFNYIYAMGGAVNWHNQFVQLAINAGQRYLLCVFANQTSSAPPTAYSLLCTDHPDGRFVVQLAIQVADVNATSCVPSRLFLTAAFGSLPVPLDATNANGTTSDREVVSWGGYLDLLGSPATTAAQMGAAEEQDALGGSRFPSVANMWYRWLSSELRSFDNQTANMSTVVQRQVAAHFFNQVGVDGQPNPFGQSVQVDMRGDTYSYFALCTFQDQLTLTCVDSLQGLLVHRFQVQEESLDPVSRVPSRLRAFLYGSLPVPDTAEPVQQVLLAMGEPVLS